MSSEPKITVAVDADMVEEAVEAISEHLSECGILHTIEVEK